MASEASPRKKFAHLPPKQVHFARLLKRQDFAPIPGFRAFPSVTHANKQDDSIRMTSATEHPAEERRPLGDDGGIHPGKEPTFQLEEPLPADLIAPQEPGTDLVDEPETKDRLHTDGGKPKQLLLDL